MGLLDSMQKSFALRGLPKVGVSDPTCPYCNDHLDKKPAQKKQCPHCGKYIYVRTRPQDNTKVLVTDEQVEVIEEQWSIVNGTHDEYLASKQKTEAVRSQLAKQFGAAPSENDVKWSLLNEEAMEHCLNGDWGLYRNTRFEMAEILRKESKFKQALFYYCWVCYLDLNGPRNTGGVKDPALRSNHPPFSLREAFLAPGIIKRMVGLIKKLHIGNDEVLTVFNEAAEHDYKGSGLPVKPADAWDKLRKELFV